MWQYYLCRVYCKLHYQHDKFVTSVVLKLHSISSWSVFLHFSAMWLGLHVQNQGITKRLTGLENGMENRMKNRMETLTAFLEAHWQLVLLKGGLVQKTEQFLLVTFYFVASNTIYAIRYQVSWGKTTYKGWPVNPQWSWGHHHHD